MRIGRLLILSVVIGKLVKGDHLSQMTSVLITIISVVDPCESAIFKSKVADKRIWS